MSESRGIGACGLALVGVKLAFLPFQTALPTGSILELSDCAFILLLAYAAWRASRRSHSIARVLWLSVVFFSLLQAVSFGLGVLAFWQAGLEQALSSIWPTTILSYFITIVFVIPLLLREDVEAPAISPLQTLDLAQLAILMLAAYLAFFYIPGIHEPSSQRAYKYMVLHLTRDGFLALCYLYRGWRCRIPDLRRLFFRFAAFFTAFGAIVAPSVPALAVWHWPPALLAFLADLPALILLFTAIHWRQSPEKPVVAAPEAGDRSAIMAAQTDHWTAWNLVFPLIVPFSVIALASRIATIYPRVAWSTIVLSFVCYAGRLLVMQRQQEEAMAELIAAEDKFARVFKDSPASVAVIRFSDGKYLEVNDHWLKKTGLTREQVIGKTGVDFGLLMKNSDYKEMMQQLQEHGACRNQNLQLAYKGTTVDVIHTAVLMKLRGEPMVVTTALDVTEFKSVIHQLHHAQKMQVVGTLAGGVAHDFNNLLTVITGYSALALNRDLDPELADEIGQIKEAAAKAAALTRQLLAFSRRQVMDPRNINLNQTITEMKKLLGRTIGENIKLHTVLANPLSTVYADPAQMEQVVMNLAVNARDAMPNGGDLLFETKNLDLPEPYPQDAFEIPAGRYVMLAVTDTGTGIAADTMERLFEPFFTTKGVGKGTGLGLSMVYGIVTQSGGYVWAYSQIGTGTTFKVCLPAVDAQPDAFKAASTSADLHGTETVLVVDDDARVRELTSKVLRQFGYHVLTSDSGENALLQSDQFPSVIDLLVTDLIMEKMNGWELAQQLQARRPGLRTLYVSGYAQFPESGSNGSEGPKITLHKPFAPSDLALQVKKALGVRIDR